eukprot:s2262_g7.t1
MSGSKLSYPHEIMMPVGQGGRLRCWWILAFLALQVLWGSSQSFTPSRSQGWGKAGRSAVALAAVVDVTTAEELDEAIAKTAQEDPNVLIVGYSTTWCGPCKLMDPKVKELSEMFEGKALTRNAMHGDADRHSSAHRSSLRDACKVDDDANFVMGDKDAARMQIMKREQVRTVPLYQIYKDGQKVGSVSGADADRLTSKIEQHTGMKVGGHQVYIPVILLILDPKKPYDVICCSSSIACTTFCWSNCLVISHQNCRAAQRLGHAPRSATSRSNFHRNFLPEVLQKCHRASAVCREDILLMSDHQRNGMIKRNKHIGRPAHEIRVSANDCLKPSDPSYQRHVAPAEMQG